jgi:hypothetical protein
MRSLIAAVALAALPLPAVAQNAAPVESVVVNGGTLAGVWKFTVPGSFKGGLFGKTEWGPAVGEFCEIEEMRAALTVHCPGLHIGSEDVSRGTVSLNKGHIRMAWGSMRLYFAINGALSPNGEFTGVFSAQFLGISSDDPEKVTGERLSLSADKPDKGGKSDLLARLLDQMANGAVTEPRDPDPKAVKILKPDTLHALGGLQSIIYIGDKAEPAGAVSVYDAELANGHLICELRQDADGKLDYLDCG